jgi:hypothetical protein
VPLEHDVSVMMPSVVPGSTCEQPSTPVIALSIGAARSSAITFDWR